MPSYIDDQGHVIRNGERLKERSELLKEAERIITQDRNSSYGEPDDHFQHVAKIANALGFRIDAGDGEVRELRGSDHTLYMLAVKLSRLMVGDMQHRDSWMDIAGYAGCGYETATLEAERRIVGHRPEIPPSKVDLISGNLSMDIVEAAQKAVTGDPSDLEQMGYILADTANLSSWLKCAQCGNGHILADNCAYRVKMRRNDG